MSRKWIFEFGLMRRQDGTTAVEFALISPVLFVILFGIIGYGALLGITHGVQDVAGQAARDAVGGMDANERIALASNAIQRAAAANPLLDIAKFKIAAGPDPADPDRFLITLDYDLSKTIVSILPGFLPFPKTVVRSASVRRGGL